MLVGKRGSERFASCHGYLLSRRLRQSRAQACSLFADRAPRARHQIRVLLDVMHASREHFELVVPGDAIGLGRGGHLAGIERRDLLLERGNALLLRHLHRLLSYTSEEQKS